MSTSIADVARAHLACSPTAQPAAAAASATATPGRVRPLPTSGSITSSPTSAEVRSAPTAATSEGSAPSAAGTGGPGSCSGEILRWWCGWVWQGGGSLGPQPGRLPQAHTPAMRLGVLQYPQHLPASLGSLLAAAVFLSLQQGWGVGTWQPLEHVGEFPVAPWPPSAGDPGSIPWPPFIEHLLYARHHADLVMSMEPPGFPGR